MDFKDEERAVMAEYEAAHDDHMRLWRRLMGGERTDELYQAVDNARLREYKAREEIERISQEIRSGKRP